MSARSTLLIRLVSSISQLPGCAAMEEKFRADLWDHLAWN